MKMHIVRQSLATNFQISFQITFCVDGLKLKSPADGRRRASQRDDGFTERACGRWKQWKALSLRRHSDVLLQKLLTSRLKLNNSSRADFQTQPFTILEPRYIRHRGSNTNGHFSSFTQTRSLFLCPNNVSSFPLLFSLLLRIPRVPPLFPLHRYPLSLRFLSSGTETKVSGSHSKCPNKKKGITAL